MIEVVPLTESALENHAPEIISIENSLVSEMGALYSHEHWKMKNFRYPLPDKWQLSSLAILGGCVVGFWVASRHSESVVHSHRVGVLPSCQANGVGSKMWESLRERILLAGARCATLTVRRENLPALMFYQGLGFGIVEGESLYQFLEERGRKVFYRKSYILDQGLAYVLLKFEINVPENKK